MKFVLIKEGELHVALTEDRCFRQGDAESCTPAGRLFNPGLALVAQGNFTHNGEANTGAPFALGFFAAEKNVEYGFPLFGRHARTVVTDKLGYSLVLIPTADFDGATFFCYVVVGVAE